MSMFGKALGILELELGDVKIALTPKMGDVKEFRDILVENTKDKKKLYELFSSFMVGLINRAYPEEKVEDIQVDVEVYLNPLFEKMMVAFKWTSEEEMEKAKKEAMQDIKKQMSSV